jgi:hypothetical protein
VATKAERFKEQQQRSSHKKPKQPRHPKRKDPGHVAHNQSRRGERNAVYELETTTARPSRKSSRKSHQRAKNDSALKNTFTALLDSPSRRAGR